MWDAGLVSRVRDRKLNEIMIFASMAKIDSGNIDDYIDIIVSLGDDIDACDTLLDTDGETEISLEAIDDPAYLERLSPGERADEDAFNAMKVDPAIEESVPEDLADYVRQLISDAVESIKSESDGSRDALNALKEELAIVRKRNEELSEELDFKMTENASVSDELSTVQNERDALQSELASLRKRNAELESAVAQLDSLSEELSKANEQIAILKGRIEELQSEVSAKDNEIAAVETEMEATLEDNSELAGEVEALKEEISDAQADSLAEEMMSEAPVTEKAEQTGKAPAVDRILTDSQREIVAAAKAMKDAKMDEFIDLSMEGKMDETICDNIVSFLKVDISICDALLGMHYSDLNSILDGFRRILSIIDESPEPRSQSIYSNSLTPDQAVVEYGYNKVIEHIQEVMLSRYADML